MDHPISKLDSTTQDHICNINSPWKNYFFARPGRMDTLPDTLVVRVFKWVAKIDSRTLVTAVPATCRLWAALCKRKLRIDIDVSFAPGRFFGPFACSVPVFTGESRKQLPLDGAVLLGVINRFERVRGLDLQGCGSGVNLKAEDLFKAAAACPELERLMLGYLPGQNNFEDYCIIKAEVINAFGKHCPDLKVLSIRGCNGVGNVFVSFKGGMKNTPCCWHKLEELDVSFCEYVNDHDVKTILESNPGIRTLNLNRAGRVGGVLADIARLCPNLESLDARSSGQFHDWEIFFKAVANNCPKLTSLAVKGLPGIEQLIGCCVGLVKLDLSCQGYGTCIKDKLPPSTWFSR